jgi:hypothetical protein
VCEEGGGELPTQVSYVSTRCGPGMLDGSGKFSGVAAKEMEEETGLVITEDSVRVPAPHSAQCSPPHTRAPKLCPCCTHCSRAAGGHDGAGLRWKRGSHPTRGHEVSSFHSR